MHITLMLVFEMVVITGLEPGFMSQEKPPAPSVSYESFCAKDGAERRQLFETLTREQKMGIARAQLEHWRDANRSRLRPEQVALIGEAISKAVPARFSSPRTAAEKATLDSLEARLEAAFSAEDLEILDEWPYGPCTKGLAARPPQALEEVFAAYAAGDDFAVERWLPTVKPAGLRALKAAVNRPAPWSRARAAFLLEIAAAAPSFRRADFLAAGRSFVMSRPSRLGDDPAEDRLEVLWHQAALGMAQGLADVTVPLAYLDAIEPRFENARQRGITLETRFPLARAIAAEVLCCWQPVPGALVRDIPRSARSGATIDRALALFESAAAAPALRVEARSRGGIMLYHAGRHAEALAWFARVPAPADGIVGHMHHLTHGRVLEALNRPASEAAAAYKAALRLAPNDQRAGIGLAAALLRSGQAQDAAHVAADVRRMPEVAGRSLSQFQRADGRFVTGWLGEIRGLRR